MGGTWAGKTRRLYALAGTGKGKIACVHRIFTGSAPPICGKAGPAGGRCARLPRVKRTASALLSIWALMLLAAPAAFADDGVGLAGPTTDKTVTFFCFGVIVFFAVLVIVMSLIQGKLEKRKEQRRYDLDRFS